MLQFSKGHYFGIFILLTLIGTFQLFSFWYINTPSSVSVVLAPAEKNWLLVQNEIDSLKEVSQENSNKIYPFNPNFISDFKGYRLGMTTDQIDKLHNFRKQNKYVNSNSEFQALTGVSSSWMKQYAKFFKFPDWVSHKKPTSNYIKFDTKYPNYNKKDVAIVVQDINTATQEELEKVFMIGEKLALKILNEKDKFGSFTSMEQLSFIWGISPEAIADLNKKFQIKTTASIKKININNVTIKDLQQFPYFNYYIAKNIVTYRTMNGDFKDSNELTNVKQFPVDKLKIIALYLEF